MSMELLIAVCDNDLKKVQELILHHKASVKFADDLGNTALIHAASRGYIEIIDFLMAHGSSLEEANFSDANALFSAVLNGKIEVIDHLVYKYKANPLEKRNKNFTAIMIAAKGGDLKTFLHLLKTHQCRLDEKAHDGSTLLLIAASFNSIKIVDYVYSAHDLKYDKSIIDIISSPLLNKIMSSELKEPDAATCRQALTSGNQELRDYDKIKPSTPLRSAMKEAAKRFTQARLGSYFSKLKKLRDVDPIEIVEMESRFGPYIPLGVSIRHCKDSRPVL